MDKVRFSQVDLFYYVLMSDDEWQAPFDGAFDETTKSFPYGTLTEGANPDVQTPPGCVRRMLDILQGYGLDFQDGSIIFVDIGCSVGAVTNMVAAETRWSCFGIDISVKHLELARAAGKELKEPSCVTYLEADYGITFPILSGQASPCMMTNSSYRFTGEVECSTHCLQQLS
jgi:SAM-dependent methyltransferase